MIMLFQFSDFTSYSETHSQEITEILKKINTLSDYGLLSIEHFIALRALMTSPTPILPATIQTTLNSFNYPHTPFDLYEISTIRDLTSAHERLTAAFLDSQEIPKTSLQLLHTLSLEDPRQLFSIYKQLLQATPTTTAYEDVVFIIRKIIFLLYKSYFDTSLLLKNLPILYNELLSNSAPQPKDSTKTLDLAPAQTQLEPNPAHSTEIPDPALVQAINDLLHLESNPAHSTETRPNQGEETLPLGDISTFFSPCDDFLFNFEPTSEHSTETRPNQGQETLLLGDINTFFSPCDTQTQNTFLLSPITLAAHNDVSSLNLTETPILDTQRQRSHITRKSILNELKEPPYSFSTADCRILRTCTQNLLTQLKNHFSTLTENFSFQKEDILTLLDSHKVQAAQFDTLTQYLPNLSRVLKCRPIDFLPVAKQRGGNTLILKLHLLTPIIEQLGISLSDLNITPNDSLTLLKFHDKFVQLAQERFKTDKPIIIAANHPSISTMDGLTDYIENIVLSSREGATALLTDTAKQVRRYRPYGSSSRSAGQATANNTQPVTILPARTTAQHPSVPQNSYTALNQISSTLSMTQDTPRALPSRQLDYTMTPPAFMPPRQAFFSMTSDPMASMASMTSMATMGSPQFLITPYPNTPPILYPPNVPFPHRPNIPPFNPMSFLEQWMLPMTNLPLAFPRNPP